MGITNKKLHNHIIHNFIGEGAVGVVYKALYEPSQEIRAIKFLCNVDHLEEQIKRFIREAWVGEKFTHPNIVKIFEVGKLRKSPDYSHFMIMEYIDGKPLKDIVQMPLIKAVDVGLQICSGLKCIHKANIVHRDLKPSNILLNSNGIVKITDFGITKFSSDTQFTKTGIVLGTPAYMSPEQCKDSSKVDHRSDIYSLGVLLFELFSGRLPFQGPSTYNYLVQHSFDEPPKIEEINPDLPISISKLIKKMLQKKPSKRFHNISKVASELNYIKQEIYNSNDYLKLLTGKKEIKQKNSQLSKNKQQEDIDLSSVKRNTKSRKKTISKVITADDKQTPKINLANNKQTSKINNITNDKQTPKINRTNGKQTSKIKVKIKKRPLKKISISDTEEKKIFKVATPKKGKSINKNNIIINKKKKKKISKNITMPKGKDNSDVKKIDPFSGMH